MKIHGAFIYNLFHFTRVITNEALVFVLVRVDFSPEDLGTLLVQTNFVKWIPY